MKYLLVAILLTGSSCIGNMAYREVAFGPSNKETQAESEAGLLAMVELLYCHGGRVSTSTSAKIDIFCYKTFEGDFKCVASLSKDELKNVVCEGAKYE